MQQKILIVTEEHVAQGLLPVRHLSYSAIRQYLVSENLFFKKYVRLEFDEQEKPAMIVWKAFHKALEKLQQDKIDNNEPQDYYKVASDEFDRIINDARNKFRDKLFPGKLFTPKDETKLAELMKTHAPEDFLTPEEEIEIEKQAIEWGKTNTEEVCRTQLKQALTNYFERKDLLNLKTISTEIAETVRFTDLEGNLMPLPIKGIIDRIVTHETLWKGLTDYKAVASLSDPNERNPGYELQAAFLYFVYYGLKGHAPDFCMFEEVTKKEGGVELKEDPSRKLLQADLRELCDKYELGWEKFEKNIDLQNKLMLAGVLQKAPTVQTIIYKYNERPDILEAALEIYRRILNRLWILAIYNVPYDELLNPFDNMGGLEAYLDFTETLENGIDTKQRPEKEEDKEIDDFEF